MSFGFSHLLSVFLSSFFFFFKTQVCPIWPHFSYFGRYSSKHLEFTACQSWPKKSFSQGALWTLKFQYGVFPYNSSRKNWVKIDRFLETKNFSWFFLSITEKKSCQMLQKMCSLILIFLCKSYVYHFQILTYNFSSQRYSQVNFCLSFALSPTSPGYSEKNCTKKPMLFLASMGETELTHDIFLNSHLGLSRSLRPKEAA